MVEGAGLGSQTEKIDQQVATPATDLQEAEWRVIGETVRGTSHQRDGRPNQDAILQVRESGCYPPVILSISDGHGSNKCFRSDRGSRLAVTVVASLMQERINEHRQDGDATEIESGVKEALPRELVQKWQAAVEAELRSKPFSKTELDQLEAKDGVRSRELVESHPLLAYGATILMVALTQSFVIYAQLGDGEIVCVSETGEVSKPLPEDERLIANETTSLCTDTATRDFRVAYQALRQPLPALIILTTDGYVNSFVDEAGFLKVGSDLLAMLRTDGFDTVNRSVKSWLEEATKLGSGDDCTLGIICRMDALKPVAAPPVMPTPVVASSASSTQEVIEKVNDNSAPT
jgi:serine/threonine protein phosphatase PrpC